MPEITLKAGSRQTLRKAIAEKEGEGWKLHGFVHTIYDNEDDSRFHHQQKMIRTTTAKGDRP